MPERGEADQGPGQDDQAARARLLRCLAEVPALIAIVRGPTHVYEFANDAFLSASGLRDVVGTPFGRHRGRFVGQDVVALLDRVYATGEPIRLPEVRVQAASPGGVSREDHYEAILQPIRDAQGDVEGILIQAVDVTERVVARQRLEAHREELREAQALLGTVIANAPIVLWSVDARGIFTLSMGRELASLGLSPGQVVGSSAYEIYRDFPEIEANIRRALAGEVRAATVTVGDLAFETLFRPLRDEARAVIGVLGVSTNVTERLRAEREHAALQAQLLQAQKMESLGVLAGGIAHDFNNLLTSILGSASAAELLLPPSSPALTAVRDAMAAARRAADLTRQLLAYAGKGRFEVRAIDLSEHVRQIAHLLESTLSKKVTLRLELASGLPAVEADVAQIQQVVVNLVVNGAEAIGDQVGTVLVTTGVEQVDAAYASDLVGVASLVPGTYVFVEVQDTGSGMDEETMAKIFDPFFTTKFTGRGLGLAAVLGIVRGHKGAMKIHSTPGRGTTFKVLLPASAKAAQTGDRPRSAAVRGSGTVLVIDDEKGVRHTLRMLLSTWGFDVLEAADGREGVDVFAANVDRIALVVLDMTMPMFGGEEVFRELRSLRPDVPVLLSSGYDEEEATRHFTAKGLAGFLQKPYSAAELAAKVQAAVAKR
jgi:signal transduction histidine kinase/ActR/RegA family two-component response regulator